MASSGCHYAQGLCRMTSVEFKDPMQAVRLLMHECERVLSDRLVSDTDLAKFNALSLDVSRKHFSSMASVRTRPHCANSPIAATVLMLHHSARPDPTALPQSPLWAWSQCPKRAQSS